MSLFYIQLGILRFLEYGCSVVFGMCNCSLVHLAVATNVTDVLVSALKPRVSTYPS